MVTDAEELRYRIGLAGQSAAVDENLTGFENVEMVGRLYGLSKAEARRRSRETLERFDLAEAADRPSKTYSGGMRRRLDVVASLVGRPKVLFLDEPTTGLDPRSRIGVWAFIRELQAEGTTILLTTQYLEEADRLADRITVIDVGKVIAEGTADELKDRIGGEVLELNLEESARDGGGRGGVAGRRDGRGQRGRGRGPDPRAGRHGRRRRAAREHASPRRAEDRARGLRGPPPDLGRRVPVAHRAWRRRGRRNRRPNGKRKRGRKKASA